MEDNISVSADTIFANTANNAISTESDKSVDDEITAMRNKIQNRQMRLIASEENDENDEDQIDLDNEEVFKRSGLEDAVLMQRIQNARTQYRQYLEEMERIPDIMQLRANHVKNISALSGDITKMNEFRLENNEGMTMPYRILKKLIEILTAFKVRKFDTIESDLELCIKQLKTTQTACDNLMGLVQNTQNTLFVLRRDIDKNGEDMLRSVDAHNEKVNKLNHIVKIS
jgi:hypothetical protein